MLDSLIKIGQMLGSERDNWDDAIDYPDVSKEESKNTALFIREIVFDLDELKILEGELYAYDEPRAKAYRNLKIKGGNNKSVYMTVDARKNFEQLKKTFFGKLDKNGKEPLKGEFLAFIETECSDLSGSDFGMALTEIFKLKSDFDNAFAELEKSLLLKLDGNQKIVLVTSSLKWAAKGYNNITHLSMVKGFDEYANRKILKSEQKTENNPLKLCYASGEQKEDVEQLNLSERDQLYSMFVTTTKNFASTFSDKNFIKNYQVSSSNQVLLSRGSSFILEKLKTRIAGIRHCIIPQFRFNTEFNENIFETINADVDLLFGFQKVLQNVIRPIERNTEEIFWITFLGFESDGNFFKTINTIQDVNSLYLRQVQKTFMQVNSKMTNTEGVSWESIMTVGKEQQKLLFNFFTLYNIIPVRVDKEKRNVALTLFKSILEKRPIERNVIFEHFKELILCHRFGRWEAYKNIYKNEKFDFACRDAVFKYLAFIEFLKKLNILKDMENTQIHNEDTPLVSVSSSNEEGKKKITAQEIQAKIDAFFLRMNYSNPQQAMFYLGRILDAVARKQAEKSYESKPVLNKINFNGLDVNAIRRLKGDLFEKTLQYREIHDNCKPLFGRFDSLFEYNHAESKSWSMKPEESLFYLLSGYSFNVFA
jgi:CRISPR-associated protein Csh1